MKIKPKITEFINSLDEELNYMSLPPSRLETATHIFTEEKEGEIMGMGGIFLNYKLIPELFLVVKKEHQRKGIGTKLCKKILDATIRNYPFIVLKIYSENRKAVKFYRKIGFKPLIKTPKANWRYAKFTKKALPVLFLLGCFLLIKYKIKTIDK